MLRTYLLYTFVALSLYSSSAWAQQTPYDSLRIAFEQATEDRERMEVLAKLVRLGIIQRREQILPLIQEGLNLSEKLNDASKQAAFLKYIGTYYERKGDFPKALEYYNGSIEKGREAGDSTAVADVYHNMSMSYRENGKYDQALEYALLTLRIDEQTENLMGLGYTYNNIGLLYEDLQDSVKAEAYFFKSLEVRKKTGHIWGLGLTHLNLGNIKIGKRELDSAEWYYKKAQSFFEEERDTLNIGNCVNNIGNIFYLKEDYAKAEQYYQQALTFLWKGRDYVEIFRTTQNIGLVAQYRKDWTTAKAFFRKAQSIADSLQSDKLLSSNHKRWHDLYMMMGEPEAAIQSLKRHYAYEKKLINSSKLARMEELEKQYAIEKKEMELAQMASEKKLLQELLEERKLLSILEGAVIIFLVMVVAAIAWALRLNKKRQEEIKLKNQELEVLNQALDRFVYSASHDLRAPLMSTLGLTQLMEHEQDREKLQEYIGLQVRSLKKLDGFIGEILDYSRNARTEVKAEEVNMEELIQAIYEELSYNEESKSVEKRMQVTAESPAISDRQRLKVILGNLVSNAIRYQNSFQEQPFVEVAAQISTKSIEIRVSDNGLGIPLAHQDKIFDMFYRAHEHNQGSGLGLFIVKETLVKLNATIALQSEEGKGTVFTVRMPNRSLANRDQNKRILEDVG